MSAPPFNLDNWGPLKYWTKAWFLVRTYNFLAKVARSPPDPSNFLLDSGTAIYRRTTLTEKSFGRFGTLFQKGSKYF